MATTPAHVRTAVASKPDKPETRADFFREFLRSQPAFVDRQNLRSRLIGKSEWFEDVQDFNNAIVYAHKLGHLGKTNAEGLMPNNVAGKQGAAAAQRVPASTSPPSRTTRHAANGQHSSAQPPADERETALGILGATERLAGRALLNPSSVTLEQLATAVIKSSVVIHTVLDA